MEKRQKRGVWKWQRFLFVLLFLILVLIVLFRFSEIQEIIKLLRQVNYLLLILAVVVQFGVFAALAGLYKTILGKASFFHLFRTVIAMVFIDHAIPSFSASGNVLLYYTTRKTKVKREKAAFLAAMNIFLNFLFFFLIFVAGLIYLFVSKRIFNIRTIIGGSLLILILFILINRILWTETGARHFKTVLSWLTKRFPRARERTLAVISDFYKAKKTLSPPRFFLFLFFIFLSYLCKITAIFLVFFSLGYLINPGVLICGYVIATVLAMISYIRIGIYEASMAFGYSILGAPYDTALTATLIYRAIAFWLPFFIGFVLLRTLVRENKQNK